MACRRSGTFVMSRRFGHPKFLWQLKKIIKFWGIRHLEFKIFLGERPIKRNSLSNTLATCLFYMQSLGSLKLIVFVFPISATACRGLAISCVTQNLKTSVFRWVSSTSPGALCRISSSVAGLIPGERTSATPRSVLHSRYQTAISDDILLIPKTIGNRKRDCA